MWILLAAIGGVLGTVFAFALFIFIIEYCPKQTPLNHTTFEEGCKIHKASLNER